MNAIQKISEITAQDCAEYIRIDEPLDTDTTNLLNNLINIAKTFVCQYTGRTPEECDTFPDFVIVVLILVQDMYDNRTLYVEKDNLNKVVDCILGMHSVNLL